MLAKLKEKSAKVSNDTWVRTIVSLVALVNHVITFLDINPLPVCHSNWYTVLTVIATIITFIWIWWKNNSFTSAAQEADKVLTNLKNGK